MKAIKVLFKWIDRLTAYLAVVALVGMCLLVFLNVVMRYIFHSGLSWSEEGARYALIAVVILGVVEVTHYREHFCVDILTNAVPKPVSRIFKIIQDVLMIVIMGIMCVGSYDMTTLNWKNLTPAMRMPSWIPYGLMLLSSAVCLLYLIGHLLEDLGVSVQDKSEGEEKEEC